MWPYLLVSISGVAKRTSSQSAEIQEFGSEEKHDTSRFAQTLLRFLGSDQNFSFQDP